MKQTQLFSDFLRDAVDLNATRVTQLEASTAALERFVDGSAWGPEIDAWMPQGSWAHKTIIRPVDRGEFDADLLVFVHPVEGWDAARYINELYDVFRGSAVYGSKVRRWSHCVTITYANDKKVDVAPVVINRYGFQRLEVCNRDGNTFELTEPRRYTAWLVERNSYSGNNSFRKVTRLVKYLRDIKGTFTCPSVLLTTILGYRISLLDRYGSDLCDTPTALKTIFGRLDDWLQQNPFKPSVTNPYLPTEDFAGAWTDTQYANFRTVANRYRKWIDDAYDEPDRYESIAKWRRVFGEEFAADVVVEEARSVSKAARNGLMEGAGSVAMMARDAALDLVSLVRSYGSRALPRGFDILPHMHRPKWRRAANQNLAVQVRARLYRSKGFGEIGPVQSLENLQAGGWLYFTAHANNGLVYPTADFEVQWRVTNTDVAAADADNLRGDFNPPHEGNGRWERLEYRGVHLVEAFVIRRRTDELVGTSQPFRVVIE